MATKTKAKAKKEIKKGRVYVSASFNNTLVTITDDSGNTLAWGSSGASGFKGTRKSTPYAATSAVEKTLKKVVDDYSMSEVDIFVKGPGPGRDASLRAVKAINNVIINMIVDVTPIPHNGPRPRKRRRV